MPRDRNDEWRMGNREAGSDREAGQQHRGGERQREAVRDAGGQGEWRGAPNRMGRDGETSRSGGGDDWGAVARERAGFLSRNDDERELFARESERNLDRADEGSSRNRYQGGPDRNRSLGGPQGDRPRGSGYLDDPRPSSRVAADYGHFGGQGSPTWGDSWGSQEQGGWRGPGEMPGYRDSRTARPHFLQSSSGGQIPAEQRNWSPGPHAGRGPRGYRRSDERIHGELCDRLTEAPDVDASDLEVEVREGRVTLSGTVPDRWMKHRAEDLAEAVMGVSEVENVVRVRRRDGDGERASRPAQTAPSRPSGHNTVLHADVPELIGAPTASGGRAEKGRGGDREGVGARGRGPDDRSSARGKRGSSGGKDQH
jgi:hypothetical protein